MSINLNLTVIKPKKGSIHSNVLIFTLNFWEELLQACVSFNQKIDWISMIYGYGLPNMKEESWQSNPSWLNKYHPKLTNI